MQARYTRAGGVGVSPHKRTALAARTPEAPPCALPTTIILVIATDVILVTNSVVTSLFRRYVLRVYYSHV